MLTIEPPVPEGTIYKPPAREVEPPADRFISFSARCADSKCAAVILIEHDDDLLYWTQTDVLGDTTGHIGWKCPYCGLLVQAEAYDNPHLDPAIHVGQVVENPDHVSISWYFDSRITQATRKAVWERYGDLLVA